MLHDPPARHSDVFMVDRLVNLSGGNQSFLMTMMPPMKKMPKL